jgi:hypothetical protein
MTAGGLQNLLLFIRNGQHSKLSMNVQEEVQLLSSK